MTLCGQLLLDASAWGSNIVSSVLIIFVNKTLMSTRGGYAFQFATTLSALHYLACTASLWSTARYSNGRKAQLPPKDLLRFAVMANVSIVALNLSLMLNNVSFYQVTKLMVIPFVCLIEILFLKRSVSTRVIMSIFIVIVGVSLVTITNVAVEGNLLGIAVAALSVLSTGMQQILCRRMQEEHHVSAYDLLSSTAPLQGLTLLALGPFLDRYVGGLWVIEYQWSVSSVVALALSCTLAIFVNLSQFTCLGRFSALSFQVLGHSKTVCVLLGGWAFLEERMTLQQLMGMVLAVLGMILYGLSSLPQSLICTDDSAEVDVDAKQQASVGVFSDIKIPSDSTETVHVKETS